MNSRQKAIFELLKRVEIGMATIEPLVTKKLIEEFEKTGFSPLFSKNGQFTKLKFIENDHLQDLEKDIPNYKEYFWFLKYDQSGYSLYPIYDKLYVVSKQSGKSKEYDIGGGSTFPCQLIEDIKNNFFQ